MSDLFLPPPVGTPTAGKHGFSGCCAPKDGTATSYTYKGFSVGCFEWMPKAKGKGLKRSKAKVRVYGSVNRPEEVYERAKIVCALLDAGEYTGPKKLSVD